MLTLLLGRAHAGQEEEILRRAGASAAPRRVILVPEQYSHEVERALCRALGSGASLHTEVLSFTRLARRVADRAGGGAEPVLDAGGRMLLMYAALQSVAEQLTVYRQPSRKPAFLTGLLATVDECKSCRVGPAALVEAGADMGGAGGDKLRDIGLIYGAYEAMTARLARDPRDRLTRLAEDLGRCGWAEEVECFVWGFTDFTPQEREVLRRLLERSRGVTVALTRGVEEDPAEIFAPARRTAEGLKALARRAGRPWRQEVLPSPDPAASSLAWLEAHLFAQPLQPWEGPCQVELYTARDPRSEVERAAAEILRLAREEGLRFREMAVAARDFSPYAHLVESVFQHYGIPVFLNTMTDILQKPVLALVTGALEAVSGDYRYEDMFRFLKTGLTDLDPGDRDLLENYVLTWDIRGRKWTQTWEMHPEGYGRTFTPEDRAALDHLNALRRRVIAPLEELRACPDPTGRGRAQAVYRFLEAVDLPGRLAERVDRLRELGELKTAGEYEQLWEIVAGGLEQCARLLGDTELDDQQFSRLLTLVFSQYDVGTIPVSLDRVAAGEAPRMAHRRVKVLFLLGADGDAIPLAAPAPGLLTDQDREALAGRQIELAPRMEEKLRREMTIAYETCAIPTRRLVVSWAERDAGGGEKRPSFLVERLGSLFPGARRLREEQLGGAFRLAAPGPALDQAGSSPQAAAALRALPGWRERVEALEGARRWRRGRLSLPSVTGLYGRQVPLSATKLDQLRGCHFSHFLKYGLNARPREAAAFQAADYGTFLHYVLEQVLRAGSARPGGAASLAADPTARRALTGEAAARYAKEALRDLEGESARFRFLFRRMGRTAEKVVDNVVEELACSDFVPAAFELGFGAGPGKALPPVEAGRGLKVRLSGYVDRVDAWVHGGKRYLRVVDYKTGRKSFDFTDLKHGLGLQMLLYLFALAQRGRDLFGPEEIVPAGVLYLPARDEVVTGERNMDQAEVERARDKALRRRGLLLEEGAVLEAMEHSGEGERRFLPAQGRGGRDALATPREMAALGRHVYRQLERAAEELAGGNIDADPYWRDGDHNACRYCPYAAACHFEESCGDLRRWQRPVTAAQFWAELLGEEEKDGH